MPPHRAHVTHLTLLTCGHSQATSRSTPGWGEQGYVKLLRGKSGVGECGIKSDASYPVAKASEGYMSI